MKISGIFNGRRFILAYIAIATIGIGLLGEIGVTVYWWSYYHPFSAHSQRTVLDTYLCTMMCWIFSIFSFILVILTLVSKFIDSISNNQCASTSIIVFMIILTSISCLLGGLTGCLGFSTTYFEFCASSECTKQNMKCYNTWVDSLHKKLFEYAHNNHKGKEYGEWIYKMTKKIVNDSDKVDDLEEDLVTGVEYAVEKNSIDDFSSLVDKIYYSDYAVFNDSLCKTVGIPTLLFAIVELIGLILFCVAGVCCGASSAADFQMMN